AHPAGVPGADGGAVQELRHPARSRRRVPTDRRPHERKSDRNHDDYEWASARREPRGVRARHVAKLDRPVARAASRETRRRKNSNGEKPWISLLTAVAAYRSRNSTQPNSCAMPASRPCSATSTT